MAKNNNVIMIGNLTCDPTIREVKREDKTTHVTNYEIAVHTGNRTDFFRIATWGKQAENDAKYLKKGNTVFVQGDFQTGSYEKNGTKIPTLQLNSEDVRYLMPMSSKTDTTTAPNKQSEPEC